MTPGPEITERSAGAYVHVPDGEERNRKRDRPELEQTLSQHR